MFGMFKSNLTDKNSKVAIKAFNQEILIYKDLLYYGYLVVELDSDGIVKYANENFINTLETSSIEIEGQSFVSMIITTSKELSEYQKEFKNAMKLKIKWGGMLRIKSLKNVTVDLICSLIPYIKDNKVQKFIISGTNFTKFSNERRSFYKQFYTDPITGFSNRQKLVDNLESLSKQHDSTLIIFDIDHFRSINDFFGYNIGDVLLKLIANWLNERRPTINTLFFKLPNDNYAMLIIEEYDRSKLISFLKTTTENISNEMFNCLDNDINISMTIGAAQGKYDLLKNANTALSKSKKELKLYTVYDSNNNQDAIIGQNLHMIKIIKNAISNDRVIPVFQAIVNTKTNKIDKYETLMRIKDDENQIISPADFLNIAVKSKLYPKLLHQMVNKALQYYKASDKSFSINFSVDDLLDPQISNPILKMINQHKIGKKIIIELLESQDISNYMQLNKTLEIYRSFGCQIAIDDFGSGYSNLEHILKLDLDIIKIDGSLIKNIDTDKAAQLLVKTIVAFAKDVNLQTVAEFVHSATVFQKVKELEVDYVQGFFLAPPTEYLHIEKV